MKELDNLLAAIRHGDIKNASSAIKNNPGLLDQQDDNGVTALHQAVAIKNLDLLNIIIKTLGFKAAEISSIVDKYGNTPLLTALKNNDTKISNILLEFHQPNIQTNNLGLTILHMAAQYGSPDLIQHVIKVLDGNAVTCAKMVDNIGRNPLAIYLNRKNNSKEVIKELQALIIKNPRKKLSLKEEIKQTFQKYLVEFHPKGHEAQKSDMEIAELLNVIEKPLSALELATHIMSIFANNLAFQAYPQVFQNLALASTLLWRVEQMQLAPETDPNFNNIAKQEQEDISNAIAESRERMVRLIEFNQNKLNEILKVNEENLSRMQIAVNSAKKYKVANCGEISCAVVLEFLSMHPELSVETFVVENGNHAIAVIGRKNHEAIMGRDRTIKISDFAACNLDTVIVDGLARIFYLAKDLPVKLNYYTCETSTQQNFTGPINLVYHKLIPETFFDPTYHYRRISLNDILEPLNSLLNAFKKTESEYKKLLSAFKEKNIHSVLTRNLASISKYKKDLEDAIKSIKYKHANFVTIYSIIETNELISRFLSYLDLSLRLPVSAKTTEYPVFFGNKSSNQESFAQTDQELLIAKLSKIRNTILKNLSNEESSSKFVDFPVSPTDFSGTKQNEDNFRRYSI